MTRRFKYFIYFIGNLCEISQQSTSIITTTTTTTTTTSTTSVSPQIPAAACPIGAESLCQNGASCVLLNTDQIFCLCTPGFSGLILFSIF
jgi:hypothetical protein